MNAPPLTILPVLYRTVDPDQSQSQYLRQASAIAKDLDPSTSKFTIDVAKRIWATYSSGDSTEQTVETEVAWNTNALALHLGVEGHPASYDMTSHEPFANGVSNVAQIAVIQRNSPASERAVDGLLPTVDDVPEIPPANIQQLHPSSNPIHILDLHNDTSQPSMHQDTTQPHATSPTDGSQRSSRPDPMNDMRGALMNSFQKAIHLRYPHLNVDLHKLRENFARKLTDAEVQDFMQMGRGVVEDLKRSGKIEEAKRKLAVKQQDDESEARRNRRRVDKSPSSILAVDLKSADCMDVSHHSNLSAVGGTSVASAATPTGQIGGPSVSSTDLESEGPATPICSTQQDTFRSSNLDEDVSMTVSPTPQRSPSSPHSRRSSAPSNSDHHKDDSTPSHTNTHIADTQLHSHEPADQDTMKTDDTMSDFRVPQILLAKVGQPIADVSDISFDIHERLFIAARRWAQYWNDYDPGELHMRLYLTSIPTAAAEIANRELLPNSSISLLAESVAKINVAWPPSGTFYVSLNQGCPGAISWGDHFFDPSSPPLDISNCVVSGKNTIRFIQLEDLSQRLFLIFAMPPSEKEKQRRATWKKQLAQDMMSDTIKVWFKPQVQ